MNKSSGVLNRCSHCLCSYDLDDSDAWISDILAVSPARKSSSAAMIFTLCASQHTSGDVSRGDKEPSKAQLLPPDAAR
jgi:hypothetical protein